MLVANRPLDVEPLSEDLTREQVTAFRTHAGSGAMRKIAERISNHRASFATRAACLAIFSLFTASALVTIGPLVGSSARIPIYLLLLLSLMPLKWSWDTFRREVFLGSPWPRWYRLTRFAAQNRLTFEPVIVRPKYAGSVFRRGSDRTATDVVTFSRPTRIQMGNYRYEGEVELGRVREWGFIRIELDRRLPHMMLEAKDRHPLTGTRFPVAFADEVVLSLEGDFDKHFTLHVPRHYERDALYIFTPDLMARLIDEAAAFDVEIVDNTMFIYSHLPFAMQTAGAYERLDHIVTTIGTTARSQSKRYWDDRVGSRSLNVVAPRGRRMRARVSLIYVAGISAVVGAIAIVFIAGSIMTGGR